jgi:REP element-mobilizing transposase RayT
MWNDTDVPLAYLITFRSYGTWLHGDQRGSIDREHNRYGGPFAPANVNRRRHNKSLLKGEPVWLDTARRNSIEKAIKETCVHRKWELRAFSVRTNHVHSVVSANSRGSEIVLNAFKANATRQMREDGCWQKSYSPWVDKGSTRNLWNERSVARALDYVINGQGEDLPEFD